MWPGLESSGPDLSLSAEGSLNRTNPDIKWIIFYFILKLLIIILFHTTGGSDEAQDFELAKVGAYVQSSPTKTGFCYLRLV